MVVVTFSYTDQISHIQEACHGDQDLESCLDLLSLVVRQQFVLLKIYLLEGNRQIELPVQAFDGQLMGDHIRELKRGWQMILNQP